MINIDNIFSVIIMKQNTKKIGRPTKYTPELAKLICQRIATNTDGLKKLCVRYNDMPSHETINQWRWQHPEFLGQYLAAKSMQMNLIIEECEDLFDNVIYYTDSNGNKRIDPASVTKQVAKVNLRKWHASKLNPKMYSNNKQLDLKHEQDKVLLQDILELRAKLAKEYERDY